MGSIEPIEPTLTTPLLGYQVSVNPSASHWTQIAEDLTFSKTRYSMFDFFAKSEASLAPCQFGLLRWVQRFHC